MENEQKKFYKRLQKVLAEKNIMGRELAKVCGVTEGSVSKWLHGESVPRQDKLEIITNYLQVSADYLLGKTDTQQVNKESQDYSIPDSINTFEEARDFLKSLNLYAYGGIDLNQKSESDIITLARTILSTLQIQGKL